MWLLFVSESTAEHQRHRKIDASFDSGRRPRRKWQDPRIPVYFPFLRDVGLRLFRRREVGWSLFISNGKMNVNTASEPFFISMVTDLNIGPHRHKLQNINNIVRLKWLISERQTMRKSTLLSTFLCPSNILSRDLGRYLKSTRCQPGRGEEGGGGGMGGGDVNHAYLGDLL